MHQCICKEHSISVQVRRDNSRQGGAPVPQERDICEGSVRDARGSAAGAIRVAPRSEAISRLWDCVHGLDDPSSVVIRQAFDHIAARCDHFSDDPRSKPALLFSHRLQVRPLCEPLGARPVYLAVQTASSVCSTSSLVQLVSYAIANLNIGVTMARAASPGRTRSVEDQVQSAFRRLKSLYAQHASGDRSFDDLETVLQRVSDVALASSVREYHCSSEHGAHGCACTRHGCRQSKRRVISRLSCSMYLDQCATKR
jgi:hypothetical protein